MEMADRVRRLKEKVPGLDHAILSMHCHDDLGMSTANTLAGIVAGARQAEVTVNGIGERTGNAPLAEVALAVAVGEVARTGIRPDHLPLPDQVRLIDHGGQGRPRAVPIPGHSATHTALLHEPSRTVLTGDLFVTGGATAVMSHENPFESIASLRRVAALEPLRMLTGHALVVESPAGVLRRKADAVEAAAARVLALHASGAGIREIVRRVFPNGRAHDLLMQALTGGEFSRSCFVRAVLRHAP